MKRALLLAAICWQAAMAAPPAVTKVEPPDWVAEPGGASLRILVTGSNLAGAAIEAPLPTARVSVSAGGTHLFVDLKLPPGTRPGQYPLRIRTAAGTALAPFAVVPPLAPEHRFQGFSNDDVVYLIMPDRFANGDP
jgi:hypothetical protein